MSPIRAAVDADNDAIQALGRTHAMTAGVPNASFPAVGDVEWYVIDGRDGSPCCALALREGVHTNGTHAIQVILLWNHGREQTLAAARLIKHAIDLSFVRQKPLWFTTIANAPVTAIQCFMRFGFQLTYSNGTFATYERKVA